MKFFLLTILACCISTVTLFAQNNYSIKGAAVDTESVIKLRNATVIVLNAKDSILRKFTRANETGNFSVDGLKPGKFILLISYPDYADYVEQFSLDSASTTHNFGSIDMRLKSRILKEVMIKGDIRAIKIKGDTTEFNAKAYITQPNAKVEDLLKQLPGIQVDKDGKITANGEAVNKVLVDGEEFFGDDPTLVTKNIRADMVDKVQLYDKKSDQAAFTGIDDGVKTKTINIKLKEDKKNGVFGKASAGIGTDGYYEGQAIYNKFKAKEKFSAYGTIANDGKTGLGYQDNDKLGTSPYSVQIDGNGDLSFSSNSSSRDALDSYSGTYDGKGLPFARSGGLHYEGKSKNDNNSLNANYKIGAITVDGATTTNTQQTLPTGTFTNNSGQTFNNYAFRQKLDATYQIKIDTTANIKFAADATIKAFNVKENYLTTSYGNDTLVNRNNRAIVNAGDQHIFNASMLYTKKFKKPRRTFSWNVSETYNNNQTHGTLISEIDFYNKLGAIDSTQKINQYKTTNTTSSVLNSNFTYSEPISKAMSVQFNYATGFDNSNADRKSYNQSAQGVYNLLDTTYSNHYLFNQLTNQVGAVFTYKKNKVTLNFGSKVSDVNFKQTDEVSGNQFKRDFINFSPQANLQFKISQQEGFRFNYNGRNAQPTIEEIQPVKVNTDPLNIILGNPALKPSFNNSFNVNYNSYKVFSGQNIYSGLNYSFTTNPIVNNSVTDKTDKTTTQYVNLTDHTPYNYNVYINLGRKIKPVDMDFNISLSTGGSVSYSYINGALNTSTNRNYNINLYTGKYIEKKFDFYFQGGPSYNINQFSLQPGLNNNAPGFNGNLGGEVYLPGKFQIATDNSYTYTGKTQLLPSNERLISNASITKSFFKADNLKFIASVNNLFNQDVNFNRNVAANTITQTSTTGIKRYFMLSVNWDFTKFGTVSDKK
jgi:hypothetical protein